MPISDDLHERITDRAIALDRVKGSVRADAYAALRDLERNLVAELSGNSPVEVRTAYQRKRLEALLRQTRRTIAASYGGIARGTGKNLQKVANAQSAYLINEVNAQVGVDIMTVGLSPQQITSIASNTLIQSAPSKDWWSRQATDLQANFSDAVRQGMLRGETTDQIIRRVRGTAKNGFADGIMQARKRHIDAVVRTSVQTVANEAGLQTFEANQDVLKGIQWTSTLDSRTTKICMALHGLVWHYRKDGSLKPVGHDKEFPGPTAHWNCRSTQVPVLKSFDELAGEPVIQTGGRPTDIDARFDKELAAAGMAPEKIALAKRGARASMDGYVARDLSFDSWLGKKGTATQDRMLGKKRADLWRQKKISTRDLIDQTGRPLKVAELGTIAGTPQLDRIAALVAEGEKVIAKQVAAPPPATPAPVPGTKPVPAAEPTVRSDLKAYPARYREWAKSIPASTAEKIVPPTIRSTRGKVAYYSPGRKTIALRKVRDGTPDGRITFLHEWGHHAHFEKGIVTNYSVDQKFLKLVEKGRERIPKEISSLYKKKKKGERLWWDEAKAAMNKALKRVSPDAAAKLKALPLREREKLATAFWDTIGSMTRGKMGAGHTVSYYWEGNNAFMEIAAHAFAANANVNGNPYLEAFFQDIVEYIAKATA